MNGPAIPAQGPGGGWVLQWWQAKACTFERVVHGPGSGRQADPDVMAAPTVVRLLQANDYWELAHEAAAAWAEVDALARTGTPPRMLAAVTVRIAVAFSTRLADLAAEIACQSGDPGPSRNASGHPPPG